MLNNIFTFAFKPSQVTKAFLTQFHTRDILFLLFIFNIPIFAEILSTSTYIQIKFPEALLLSFVFSALETYVGCILGGLILHIIDKFILKIGIRFKNCCKLVLPFHIVSTCSTICLLLVMMFLPIPDVFKAVYSFIRYIYCILLLLYYLQKIYHVDKRKLTLIGIVYLIIDNFPKILNMFFT